MVDQEGIALAADLKLGEDGAEAIDVEAGPEDLVQPFQSK